MDAERTGEQAMRRRDSGEYSQSKKFEGNCKAFKLDYVYDPLARRELPEQKPEENCEHDD